MKRWLTTADTSVRPISMSGDSAVTVTSSCVVPSSSVKSTVTA